MESHTESAKKTSPKAVRSYLVFNKIEPPKSAMEAVPELIEPVTEKTPQEAELTAPIEITDATLEPSVQTTSETPFEASSEASYNEQLTDNQHEPNVNVDDSTTSRAIDISGAAEHFLQSELTKQIPQWRPPTPLGQTNGKKRNRPHSAINPFVPENSGLREIAQSADGSRIVQHGKNCFSVEQNEFQDSLWVPTPCPNSADKNRAQLRESFEKFGIGR